MIWNVCTKAGQPPILVLATDPVPEGYTAEAQTANPNYLVVLSSGLRRITKLAFRNRFTSAEKIALEMASLDNPAATLQQRQIAAALRVYLKDVDNAKWIDLDRADTGAGVMQLAALGIITAERGAQVLNNPHPTRRSLGGLT